MSIALTNGLIGLLQLLTAAALLGWLLGGLPWWLLLALSSWLILQSVEFHRFWRWARKPLSRPANHSALWQTPTDHLYRTLQQSRERSKSLLERLDRMRVINQALPDAAVLINPAGQIELYNDAAARLLELRPENLRRSLVGHLRHPQLIALLEGKVPENLVELPAPGPIERRLEVRRIRIDKDNWLILARDVTQLNRLLTMRQDFVANVSHELRTPLTVIIGYLEALEDQSLDQDTVQQLVQKLSSPAHRMKALVDDLLLLTRLESSPVPVISDLDPINVPVMLRQLASEAEQLSNGRHEILVEADNELGLIGIETELHSAFINLVTNAIRYSPNGGRIWIRWYRTGRGPCFEVQDEGVGIAPEHLSRITERFYRVDLGAARVRGGTGLGLAIVKHVLKRHDATLQVQSSPGAGSRFYSIFPDFRIRRLPTTARQAINRDNP
jgi:two-component system, OmpR family, phosphate regulon sensor histidine kinase PhoR